MTGCTVMGRLLRSGLPLQPQCCSLQMPLPRQLPPPPSPAPSMQIRFRNANEGGFMRQFEGRWCVQPFSQDTLDQLSLPKQQQQGQQLQQEPWFSPAAALTAIQQRESLPAVARCWPLPFVPAAGVTMQRAAGCDAPISHSPRHSQSIATLLPLPLPPAKPQQLVHPALRTRAPHPRLALPHLKNRPASRT